jgi:hypothetical protein
MDSLVASATRALAAGDPLGALKRVALRDDAKFCLELHPEKTRLLEFGPSAAENRRHVGLGKPETFNVLGFTHICGRTRKGRFTVLRQTERKRLQAKLGEVKAELWRRLHDPVPGGGCVAALGHPRTPAVLRGADELAGAVHVLWPGGAPLVPGLGSAQSTGARLLDPDAAAS